MTRLFLHHAALWIARRLGPARDEAVAMPRVPAPLPESLPWPVFTRFEALAAGLHAERLRRSDLVQLRRGLFMRRGHRLEVRDVAEAICRSDPSAVIVRLSAAQLHDLPLPRSLEPDRRRGPVHIAVPGGRNGSDRFVRWHNLRLAAHDVEHLSRSSPRESPLRLSTRARTWRDLAPDLPHWRRVAIGDSLVRIPRPDLEHGRARPWCTIEELRAQCTGRHSNVLRAAAEDVRIGADSPMETRLRLAFYHAGLPTSLLNQALTSTDGQHLHEADFQWPEYRVCAEYDGASHDDAQQVERDIKRARRAARGGWTEVRLYSKDIHDGCAGAIHEVRTELAKAGWIPERMARKA